MRKLKVSLICVFAALLCCAFAAFIGIYAYNGTQSELNANTETTEEISAPEHGTTSGGILTEQEGDGISAPERTASATATTTENIIFDVGFSGESSGSKDDKWMGYNGYGSPDGSSYTTHCQVYYDGNPIEVAVITNNSSLWSYPGLSGDLPGYCEALGSIGYTVTAPGAYTYTLKLAECDSGSTHYVSRWGNRSTTITLKIFVAKYLYDTYELGFSGSGEGITQYELKDPYTYEGTTYYKTIDVAYTGSDIVVFLDGSLPLGYPGLSGYTPSIDNRGMYYTVSSLGSYERTMELNNFGPPESDYYFYSWGSGEHTLTLTINVKKTISPEISYESSMPYGGTQTLGVTGNLGNSSVKWVRVYGSGSVTLSSNTAAEPTLTATGVGTVKLYAEVASSSDYMKGTTPTVTITITKADVSPTASYGTVTYGSDSGTPTVDGNPGGGTPRFSVAPGTGSATINPTTGVLTPVKAGTVTVTVSVTETTNYNACTGSATTVTIESKDVASVNISEIPSQTYTGGALTPAITVKDGTTTLVKDTDYTVTYDNNIHVGTATVTITGKGNYTGTNSATFAIEGKDIAASTVKVSAISPQTYTGGAIKPELTIKDGETALVKGTDYTVSYLNNTNAGTATVTITGIGNYSGSRPATFTISAKSISSATVNDIAEQTYTGGALTPAVTVKDGETTLTGGTDYTVSYINNIDVGEATVTIKGTGNYTGAKTVHFNIVAKSISASTVTVSEITAQTYTGSPITPEPTVKDGTTTLVRGTHYTLSYSGNTDKGTATITINGIGNYKDSRTATFTISTKSISASTVTVSEIPEQTYTGSAITPALTITDGTATLELDTDYTLSYSPNIDVGTVTVTITGKGNYSGTRTTSFAIAAKSISATGVTVGTIDAQTYTGSAITPEPTVTDGETTLIKGTHYTLSYLNNKDAGEATVTVTGIGNYKDAQEVRFTISAKSISSATVNEIADQTYTGSAIEPAVTVKDETTTLTKGTHYTVTYVNNVNKGEATVIITGTGNYTGAKTVHFNIVAKNISALRISAIDDQAYTGAEIQPEVIVKDGAKTLVLGTDYTVEYADNTDVGEAKVTVTCIGNYTGTKEITFNIVEVEASSLTVDDIDDQTYTGGKLTPTLTVKNGDLTLEEGTDYELEYLNNTNAGEATVTITGKGNYTGAKTVTFNIVAKSISSALIGTIDDQTYTGSAITPAPTVKLGTVNLVKDTDYTLSYSPNVTVCTVTLTVTGKGNYTGTKTATFKIIAKSIATADIDEIADQTYTGSAIEPAVTVKDGEMTLDKGTDYAVEYSENTEAGTATVKITGLGNYTGTATATFEIKEQSLNDITVEGIDDQPYTGEAIELTLTVKLGEATLAEGTDYTLAYADNTNAGEATVTVTGIGNYSGTKTVIFNIVAKSITSAITEDIADQTYTGSAIEPALTVKDGEKTLAAGTDYTVECTGNTDVGEATVTITGIGNYAGTVETTFNIVEKDISSATVTLSETEYVYDGNAKTPEVTVEIGGLTLTADDYTVEYADNVNFGTATVTITGKGNYTGTATATFTIKKAPEVELSFNDVSVIYDGQIHYITVTGTLPDEVQVEYYLTGLSTKFEGATDVKLSAGAVVGYKVTAKFTCESGNYAVPEDMNAVLTITPRTITESDVSGIQATYAYTGAAQKPSPVVKLTLNGEEITLDASKDYRVSYSTETPDAGTTVELEVTGTGNYDGSVTKSFTVTKKILNVVWVGDNITYKYTGSPQGVGARLEGLVDNDLATVVPVITYSGRGATEYGDSSEKPVNAGYYTVSVSLDGAFTNYEAFEAQTKNFQIEQADITVSVEFDGYDPATDTLYTGGALPDIKIIAATFNGAAVAGELSWVDIALREELNGNYTWQYVPEDTKNLKTFTGVIQLNATRAPIDRIEAALADDAPIFYVTTTFEEIRNYIIVTGYLAGGDDSTEIKGYTLTCDRFDELPEIADVYQLTINYNGKSCTLEVEYKPVAVLSITVTAKNPDAGIKTDYEGYDVFDRSSVIVTAERNDGYVWVLKDDEYKVEYVSGKGFLTVGETYVTISYGTDGNRKAQEVSVTVEKKQFDLSANGITFNDETVTYDGNVITAAITGAFTKGTVRYEYYKDGKVENVGLGVTDAGVYEVRAIFTFDDETDKLNYKTLRLTKTLTVEKAVYGNVTFNNVTADYTGNSLEELVKVEGLSDEVAVTYSITNKTTGESLSSLNEIKNAGTYEIVVSFTVDGNHMPIADKKATVKVNKIKPVIDPKWRGSLTLGTQLKNVLLEAGEGEVAGTYKWKSESYELQAGLNRCSYIFTPEDTTNYEEVTSYIDLTVVGAADVQPENPANPVNSVIASAPDWATYLLVVAVVAVLIVAIVALAVALKVRRNTSDSDGFYDNVSPDDLK